MYFEIDNTPEHIRKLRRVEQAKKEVPKEEVPRLILAPFSRPPQVLFDNVLIGTSCERHLEVFNPTKCVQQVMLEQHLPHGLQIHLPDSCLLVEPETCYYLTMCWTPMQPTALRETIHFTNDRRGRYDVIVVLKSAMNIKGRHQPKGSKSQVQNKKKPLKKSPVAIHKKKVEENYNATTVKRAAQVIPPAQFKKLKSYNMENISGVQEYCMDSQIPKCPFDSPNSVDFHFNTSEIFSNMKRPHEIMQQTYDKSTHMNYTNDLLVNSNILKPSNRQSPSSTDIFDNFTFTPLKSASRKNERLEHGPKILLSMNSDCDEDSLDNKENDENGPQSIVYVTSAQTTNKWTARNPAICPQNHYLEKPVQDKNIPNTSSPKELHSPNFSMNTEFSRISDLSFCPQRFSTERKMFPKFNNETHDLIEDFDAKPNSDTFTKEFPTSGLDCQMHFTKVQNPSKCKQSLFNEYNFQKDIDKKFLYPQKYETNVWRCEPRTAIKIQSPPRSLTPPLQSIPEESNHNSETHILDKTDKTMNTFTMDRTFNTTRDRNSISSRRQTWSKKDVRADPTLWKVPLLPDKPKSKSSFRKSDGLGVNRPSNATFECNKSVNQNISLNLVGNVYSQSLTVDPFLSSTYFYDEEAVAKFEKDVKRWLNYILTPPADLDCNVEQKMDVGKAWIENKNKEVPLAPTKEQVSSAYHNSHRLESLRRSAKALLLSPEVCAVFQKLNAQIEKKFIVIRTDRNLHLDVGLQKMILELLLCYNPLWLRIGLEALYCLVLPLKSNSDIDGLTSFIIQRMFRNPFLKNKHSKSSAPNMLLPAYMEAIKKFTLKKFFMLIYFLDQAKQRKLISHDPCLFRRNAICKESKEIVIRFTRELIAGIGDITKHLRPLGYVVSHKQTYLDEYIYAVHNIAVDIRDGVRLTKVMEIILMKNGLVNQLRTPAISRLQKIHNVQVALTALKEANFMIVGDITATDIADGHREKTMSLLWQLIHVFRAPLFETAANVIQTWWRKKYAVIVEKRQEEERLRHKLDNAARTLQCWWQRIQYNRLVEKQMRMYLHSTIIIQKYCRRWLCRTRLLKMKSSVIKIEEWYCGVKEMRKAKNILEILRSEKEELRIKSAIEIQRNIRRWMCVIKYQRTLKKIVLVQSLVRRFLARNRYLQIRRSVIIVQQIYRGKLLMKEEMRNLALQRRSAVVIQKQFRMMKQYRYYQKLKWVVKTVECYYQALLKMRKDRNEYLRLRNAAIVLQALYRGRKVRKDYAKQRYLIVKLQNKIRAHQLMIKEKSNFAIIKNATCVLQNHFRSYLKMKRTRQVYITQRRSAVVIQRRYRAYLLGKSQRTRYIEMRDATISLQKRYRSFVLMRNEKSQFEKLKASVILIQTYYRALLSMRECKHSYERLRAATTLIQRKYRARIQMKKERSRYLQLRSACLKLQTYYRAVILSRQQRNIFHKQKSAALKIQNWFRSCKKGKEVQQQYHKSRQACVTIQRIYRNYIVSKKQRIEYLRIKTATLRIQTYYRSYIEMKSVRQQFIHLKTSTITIQRFYRGHLETKKQREVYLRSRQAALLIQNIYRSYRETAVMRQKYCILKQCTMYVQRRYRSILAMRKAKDEYDRLRKSTLVIQTHYRALLNMRKERAAYLKLKFASRVLQTRYRAKLAMKSEKLKFNTVLKACISIQRFIRAYIQGRKLRKQYLKIRDRVITLQRRYRAMLAMRRCRDDYLMKKAAAICIQRSYRAHYLMLRERTNFIRIVKSCTTIQRYFKANIAAKKQRILYLSMKSAAVVLQRRYRSILETRKVRNQYILLKQSVITVQRKFRAVKAARAINRESAAIKIQTWYRSIQARNLCRTEFLKIKFSVTLIQSQFRMCTTRRKWLALKNATLTIQRFYKSYKTGRKVRDEYVQLKASVIKLQSLVRRFIIRRRYVAYLHEVHRQRREAAAICIQKYIKRYQVQSRYLNYRKEVVFVQRLWRGKLLTRRMHYEFVQKKKIIVKLQAVIKGYLVRRKMETKRLNLIKLREEQRRHWAASKVQALFRGHAARARGSAGAAALRRRWRRGALLSTQDTLEERNEEAMDVLNNFSDMESIIKAFKSLELLTEVFPMMYNETAPTVVRRVYTYMSFMNRSISSVEVLKLAVSVLANLTRYRITGPKIYAREHVSPILKYMWRFSNSETHLFLILCTYLWLFAKYDVVREDLCEYLRMPENYKVMVSIRNNVDRVRRMTQNASKQKPVVPGKPKLSASFVQKSVLLPALEPDYGITRVDQPRYFEDTQQAIHCLFRTYKL